MRRSLPIWATRHGWGKWRGAWRWRPAQAHLHEDEGVHRGEEDEEGDADHGSDADLEHNERDSGGDLEWRGPDEVHEQRKALHLRRVVAHNVDDLHGRGGAAGPAGAVGARSERVRAARKAAPVPST